MIRKLVYRFTNSVLVRFLYEVKASEIIGHRQLNNILRVLRLIIYWIHTAMRKWKFTACHRWVNGGGDRSLTRQEPRQDWMVWVIDSCLVRSLIRTEWCGWSIAASSGADSGLNAGDPWASSTASSGASSGLNGASSGAWYLSCSLSINMIFIDNSIVRSFIWSRIRT